MHNLVTAPIRAGRHLVIWIVWQSTGITLLAPDGDRGPSRINEEQEAASRVWLRQAG